MDENLTVDEKLTVKKVADTLDVSEDTVRRLISSGELTATRITPRKTRVRKSDLDAYIQRRTIHTKHADVPTKTEH